MYYGEIKKTDIANGIGVRVSLFVSGCTHCCKNCFNAETWCFTYGRPFTADTERELLEALAPSYINGLTVLGGEPFEPDNQRALLPFLQKSAGGIRRRPSGALPVRCWKTSCFPKAPGGARSQTGCFPSWTCW